MYTEHICANKYSFFSILTLDFEDVQNPYSCAIRFLSQSVCETVK